MMVQNLLIGVGAGVASALLFATPASGAALAPLLMIMAPLPILIAAIGWSHWAGLFAVAVAAVGLILVLDAGWVQPALLLSLLGRGAPAWWFGYLSLLARPAPTSGGLIWYPAGALALWPAL